MIAVACLTMLAVAASLVSVHPARRVTAARLVDLTTSAMPAAAGAGTWLARALEPVVRRRRARSMARPDAASLAAALDCVARHCASGDTLGAALLAALTNEPASPANSALAPARSRLTRGGTVGEALAAVPIEHPDLALAVHALRLCAEQGGNMVESLDRAASTLRERHGVRLERRAQAAQARLSAHVLTVVPIAFAGWTIATTPSVQHFAATPIGIVCVVLGLGCNTLGWWLMARITGGTT